jgi:polar amino acid transport system substrate-binding protein
MKKSFLIIMLISLGFGGAFWIAKLYKPELPEIPAAIVIGTSADFPPMAFKKENKLVGFDIDVITEAMKRIDKPFEIKDLPFELLMSQLQMGTIHVIAAGLTSTPERAKRVDFTRPYLSGDPLVIVTLKNKPAIASLDDLRNKKVAVNQGYTADAYMSKMDNIPLIRLPAVADALLALRSGKADAFVTASNTIQPLIEQYGQEEFNLLLIHDTDENSAFAITKSYPKLTEALSQALSQMTKDGTLEKIKQKWHVQ